MLKKRGSRLVTGDSTHDPQSTIRGIQ